MLSVSMILSLYRGWRVESFFLNLRIEPGTLAPSSLSPEDKKYESFSLCRFYFDVFPGIIFPST